jgi:hypothetical protein
MSYGEVLASAWKIIWRYQVLWLFGLIAGGWSGLILMFSSLFRYFLQSNILNPNNPLPSDVQAFMASALVYELLFLGLMLVFGIFAIVAGTVARIGIIRWTQLVDQGVESLNFQDLLSAVRTNFWRVIGTTLLLLIGFGLVVGVFFSMVGGFAMVTYGLGLICLLPFLALFVPISLLFRGFLEQTTAALVIENLGIGAGLARGWTLIRNKFLPLLLTSLILGFGVGILSVVFNSPYYIASWVGVYLKGSPGVSLVILIGELVYMLVDILLLSLLYAYYYSAWALTFLRLTKQSAPNAPTLVENA